VPGRIRLAGLHDRLGDLRRRGILRLGAIQTGDQERESDYRRSLRRCDHAGPDRDFSMTFIAVPIIAATSAALAGRIIVLLCLASSPKRSM